MQVPFSIPPHWLRRAVWFAGGMLVVWLSAWLVVPPIVKQLIEEKGTAALGRTVSVGAVVFRPWSLELTLSDLSVASADGKAKQLEIARLYVDAELESVVRLAPVLDAITVDTVKGQLTHLGDGRYDVDDILERLADAPASDAPLQFALYNLTLNDGAIDFHDHTASGVRQHSVRNLLLAVPFLSTLESKRTVKVVPRLAFTLNGGSFDTAAQGTPFASTQQGEASLKISKLDLAPYLPYLPSSLPVRLQSAVVDADLRLAFEQAKQQKLGLSGMLKVSELAIGNATGVPVLAVESVVAELADVRPLERIVQLKSLEIKAPTLQGARDRAGRLNLSIASDATKVSSVTPKIIANKPALTGAIGQKSIKPLSTVAAPKPWALTLDRFTLRRGAVAWADDSTQPQARLNVTEVQLQANALRWPLTATPATFEGSASVPLKSKKVAQLAINGEVADLLASAKLRLTDVELDLAAPYVAQYLQPSLHGVLDAELDARWEPGKPTVNPGGKTGEKTGDAVGNTLGDALQLTLPRLTVRDFAMKLPKALVATTGAERAAAEMPRFKLLEITGAQLNVNAKTGSIDKIALSGPAAMLHRDVQGQWLAQRWLKTAEGDAGAELNSTNPPEASRKKAVSWQLSLAELAIDDGSFRLDDRSLARPVRLEMSALKLQLRNATQEGNKPAPLTLSARVKSGRTEPGTLNYRGTVMWAPLEVKGSLDAVDLPLHAAAPYLADQLNISILRADASFKGQVRYAQVAGGDDIQVQGDASLNEFRANTVAGTASAGTPTVESPDLGVTEEILSWKTLAVPGIALTMAPGTATRLQVRQASLSDFFARVIVNPSGRINLQDLVKSQTLPNDGAGATASAERASAPLAVATTEKPAMEQVISMGPINLVNGTVLFSDRFIRPNYSANLSELQGSLSQFASQAVDGSVKMADLDVRGRAEGTASLEITGKVNPLAKPLALDIKGKVRDLDLPPLTAYSIKYAGYGIERGKLSMDVNYTVLPNGQLTASNKLVLNQLSFGDAVKGAPNSLPVKLAVALLADSNGVIDIDLPISGSLNDPQFSFGSLVWKVVTNLVGKALTAPFSLIASALGGGGSASDELSTVVFAPGSSVLSPSATQGLDQVAKALGARPALNVTVVGAASLEQERDALKRELLMAQLLVEKRRRAAVNGKDRDAAATVTDTEYPVLLAQVYRRADITKPRTVVGLAKDIPVVEMEALLLANIVVSEDNIRQLALQRGVVVKDYLASRKLAAERLFVGAAKLVSAIAQWKPSAELTVTQR